MTNLNFLVAAYSVFFLLLFAYTMWMGARQKDIERRMKDLERHIDAAGPPR